MVKRKVAGRTTDPDSSSCFAQRCRSDYIRNKRMKGVSDAPIEVTNSSPCKGIRYLLPFPGADGQVFLMIGYPISVLHQCISFTAGSSLFVNLFTRFSHIKRLCYRIHRPFIFLIVSFLSILLGATDCRLLNGLVKAGHVDGRMILLQLIHRIR